MLAEKFDISSTAASFGVSLRTLRFYEEIGLIRPQRRGVARLYSAQDRVRLQLIVTGKRLGLSLADIRDLIDARAASDRKEEAMADVGGASSIVALMTADEIQQQLQVLERQLSDVKDAIADLKTVVAADGT